MKFTEKELKESQFSYFLGKVVTILTTHGAIHYDVSEKGTLTHFKHYGGICEGFDQFGIWLLDSEEKRKSFFFYTHIQGIIEEEQASEDHPLVQKALQQLKPPEEPLTNLSIDKLQKVLKERKI